MKNKKAGVVSLGCDKNRVDTECLLAFLTEGGFTICQTPEDCQILIVNTCAFLNEARAEAIDTVLEFAELKKAGLEKLIVTGCLPQKWAEECREGLPEVDACLGINDYPRICGIIQGLYRGDPPPAILPPEASFIKNERVLTTPWHYAYLKVADGCDNRCTYCLIPSIRGRYRSKPLPELRKEAENLAAGGVRELILVAQDTTRYGRDLGLGLTDLLQSLCGVDGIEQIRLLYCYPELVTKELLSFMAGQPKMAHYLDVPLQHAADPVLRRMGRRTDAAAQEQVMEDIRRFLPDAAVRTTFMVGFPGESEEDFEALLDFLRRHRLQNAGFFAYSREEGTPSFGMSGQIPEAVKAERLARAQEVQAGILADILKGRVGQILPVRCDGPDFAEGAFFGRSYAEAPDIDPRIRLNWDRPIESGGLYRAEITGTDGRDMEANILEETGEVPAPGKEVL